MVLPFGYAASNAAAQGVVESAPPMESQAKESGAGSALLVQPYEAGARGAGAYFAGRTAEAEKLLTAAIEYAPSDPTVYYLRGLNRLHQGDTRRAQTDLARGARLEAQMHGSASPQIDRSLAGVQGTARLTLERIRREARLESRVYEQRSMAMARKQAREEREKLVLRSAYELPIEALVSQLTVDQARQVAVKVAAKPSASMVAEAPSDPAEPPSLNPFADDTPYDDAAALAESSPAAAAAAQPTVEVDVPDEARGSVSLGGLFGILGDAAGGATSSLRGAAENAAQTVGAAGGPPPGFSAGPGGPPAGFQGGPPPGFQGGAMPEGDFAEDFAEDFGGDFAGPMQDGAEPTEEPSPFELSDETNDEGFER